MDEMRFDRHPGTGVRRVTVGSRDTDGNIRGVTDARWLDAREAAAWQAVRDLGQPLWAALGRDLYQQCGLSMADYQVLVVLSEAGESLLYRELADATGWEKSRLSHQLTRMERRDLLRREGCADDGRSARLTLTPHGRSAIEGAAPGHVAAVRRLLIDHLSESEIDVLLAIAQRTNAAIETESQEAARAAAGAGRDGRPADDVAMMAPAAPAGA